MRAMFRTIRRLSRDRRAATAVEYGFILALIVIAMFASLASVANITTTMWSNVSNQVEQAGAH